MAKASELYELLRTSAENFPATTALVYKQEQFSYSQLLATVNSLASALRTYFSEGDRVAILLPKSPAFVASIFAVLKTNAAYVPLDYGAPPERNQLIVDDCGLKGIITLPEQENFFNDHFQRKIALPDGSVVLLSEKRELPSSPPGLSYILYTSGSTGTPKGVMHTAEAALQFIDWSHRTFSPRSEDRFSSHAPFHFDLSIFDLFVALKSSATLILIDEATGKSPMMLAELISREKISIWYSTPTILNLLSVYGKMEKHSYVHLRKVLFAGEVFPMKRFAGLRKLLPETVFYNLYGPTETNVCTWYRIPDDLHEETEQLPIGKCCSHYTGKISGEGELLIKGKGLMAGYWNQETTSFSLDEKQEKWYRTGDLVSLNEKNEMIFRGRKDRMIKKNGFRIEPAEIERNILHHPGIIECAVLPSSEGEQVTIAAFLCFRDPGDFSFVRMKEFCLKHLPSYMIPDNFILLDKLPETSSNKTDYQYLKSLL